MRYSETVGYQRAKIGQECVRLCFEPRWVPVPFPHSPIWARLCKMFDPEYFQHAFPPPDLGRPDMNTEEMAGLRALRCPINPAGSNEVVLPSEFAPLLPMVRHVFETEAHINPNFAAWWCHLSFERTEVTAGTTQRVPGWHLDGFQGVRVPRHAAEHSYLWADRDPTEWCLQPLFLSHLDSARHNIFDEIARQARESNAFAGLAGHVHLIDPYVVHRSPVLYELGWRSFVRITFTKTELEDPANTVNLSLLGVGNYPPRIEARDRLYAYQGGVPWETYGTRPVQSVV